MALVSMKRPLYKCGVRVVRRCFTSESKWRISEDRFSELKRIMKDEHEFNLKHTVGAVILNKGSCSFAKEVAQSTVPGVLHSKPIMQDLVKNELCFPSKSSQDILNERVDFLGRNVSDETGCLPVFVAHGLKLVHFFRQGSSRVCELEYKVKFQNTMDEDSLISHMEQMRKVSLHEESDALRKDSVQLETLKLINLENNVAHFSVTGDISISAGDLVEKMISGNASFSGQVVSFHRRTIGDFAVPSMLGLDEANKPAASAGLMNSRETDVEVEFDHEQTSVVRIITLGELLDMISEPIILPKELVVKNSSGLPDKSKLKASLSGKSEGLYTICIEEHPRALVTRGPGDCGEVKINRVLPIYHLDAKKEVGKAKHTFRTMRSDLHSH